MPNIATVSSACLNKNLEEKKIFLRPYFDVVMKTLLRQSRNGTEAIEQEEKWEFVKRSSQLLISAVTEKKDNQKRVGKAPVKSDSVSE